MQSEDTPKKRRGLGRAAIWLGVVLLVAAALQSISFTDREPSDAVQQASDESGLRAIRIKTVENHAADPNRSERERGVVALAVGDTTGISARDLPSEGPLRLDLLLPEALPPADAVRARIVAMDGSGELRLADAVVAGARDRVRVEVDGGWLSAGRYLIEIQTTERSHFPLRRYILEVR